jgi:hypothetical protein
MVTTNDALKGPIEKVIKHLGGVIPTDGAMLEEALNLNDVLSTRLRAAEAALAEERETVRRLEGELGQALAVAARRIGELEEAIADVADGFEQQGKFGLASQLRQFLPAATTPQADESKPIATSPFPQVAQASGLPNVTARFVRPPKHECPVHYPETDDDGFGRCTCLDVPQVAQASAGPWSGNPEVCSSCHHSRTSHVEHSGPQGTCCECMCLNFTDWPDSPGDGEGGDRPPGGRPIRVFVSEDGKTLAFPGGAFTTVRACRHCGALITGGPTACVHCVRELERGKGER